VAATWLTARDSERRGTVSSVDLQEDEI